MKKVLTSLLFLFLLQFVCAQKLPHLVPVTITEMVPVEMKSQQSGDCVNADTNCRFIECRNSETTIGYLIEPKVDWWWYPGMKGDFCRNIGLREVQRAETVFANTMDRRADLAQQIQRPFTAPYFYQYIRQYVFYLTQESDTCVHINCIHISEVMPEEKYFHRHRPDLDYIVVFDGDDNFWNADLNLSQDKLLSYNINGPVIHMVEGRNDEPCGVYQKTLFHDKWWPIQEPYNFDRLPTAVKQAVSSQINIAEITSCVYFSTKYIWTYREKKNGDRVSIRKRYKKGDYYRINTDTICHGYDANGRLLYVGNKKYLGKLDQTYLSYVAEIDTMMSIIERDMSARGCNFGKYGYIQWVEQIGDHYVIAVIYNPPIHADFLRAYYTFDRKGKKKGVALEQL